MQKLVFENTRMAILELDKVDFKTNHFNRDIKRSFHNDKGVN